MLKKNLIANYVGAAFVAGSQLLLIPVYIKLLGERGWGIFSAVLALSAALLILEAGVSLGIARRFSALAPNASGGVRSFLWIERRYLGAVALFALTGIVLAAPMSLWMLPSDTSNGVAVLRLTVVMAAAQIIGSLYRSVLVGTGNQVQLNVLLVVFTAVRHSAAVICAVAGGGTAAVAGAFALGFVVEALFRRRSAYRVVRLQSSSDPTEDSKKPSTTVPLGAATLAVAGAVGALGSQLDRLVLSRVVDPATLGHYAIAATLSLAVLQLVYPLSSALLPKLERFRLTTERKRIVRRSYAMLAALLSAVWIAALLLSLGGLRRWLPSDSIADAVRPLFLVHLGGTTLNALCVPLHLRLLSQHRDRAILMAATLAFAVQLATLVFVSRRSGALAGSVAWCAGNATLLLALFLLQLQTTPNDEASTA